MKTTEWIEIQITVDPSGARAGLGHFQRTMATASKLGDIGRNVTEVWGGIAPVLGGIERAFLAVAAAAGIAGAAMYHASQKAGDFEALREAVVALEGGDAKANSVLATLREIARAPGLGISESIGGYAQIRRSGLTEDIAYRLIRELGNQNALAGGGKAELAGLITVFTQIKNRGKLQTEEANQLAERGLPIYAMLEQAFGTRDPEAIAKRGLDSEQVIMGLLAVMEDGARVAGSAKNAHENMIDAIEQSIIAIGTGLNKGGMVGALGSMSEALENLINDGTLEEFGNYFGAMIERWIPSVEEAERYSVYLLATVVDLAWKFENVLVPAIEAVWQAFKPFWTTDAAQRALAGGMDIRQSFIDTWKMEADLRRRQRERRQAEAGERGDPTLDPQQDRIATATERTANATERMANDLRDFIIGGGGLGRMGWTRADRSDYSGLAISRRRGGVSMQSISAMGLLRFQPGN